VAGAYAPLQQFEVLRDFGFGVPTGLPLPGEASGTLRHPRNWSGQSAVSLSIGYEIAVTPLQMAMAYGALANGGLLMEPRLVREVRAPDGRVLEKQEPRVVRRAISAVTSEEVNRALVEAVQDGTGTRASLGTFQVAGKSGTARATGLDGRYESGAYFASFVGFFPAENPQLVVFVKLDRPQGTYYGGATAAPVTRATMEAVLAARHPPLDRQALASIARRQEQELRTRSELEAMERELEQTGGIEPAPAANGAGAGFAAVGAPGSLAAPAPRPAVGVTALFASWEARSGAAALEPRIPAPPGTDVAVPEVRGLQARTVIRRLHGLGLHVSWEGQGEVAGTLPRAGARVHPGDTIRVLGVRPGPPAAIPAATAAAAAASGAPLVSGTSRPQAGASRVAGGQRR
jgi:cell division protein FtsI (penicillin-binding protein 3)